MSGTWSKLKNKLKSVKSEKKSNGDQESIWERYGIDESAIRENPLYEANSHEMHIEEESIPEGNLLKNIAGMPTRASIENMAGGLKMDKINKHKHVSQALNALEQYHEVMQKQQTVNMDERALDKNTAKGNIEFDKALNLNDFHQAFESLAEFVVNAEHVVKSANGLFASRSSNVQKLSPVFANLIVQANGLLPKVATIEGLVGPYLVDKDRYTFTIEELLSSNLASSRSGGISTRGIEENNGSIDVDPKKALKILANEKLNIEEKIEAFREMRRETTEKARMGMTIPNLPVGVLENQNRDTNTEKGKKELASSAEKIADAYIAELLPLMTALSDTVESYESASESDGREDVQAKQAEIFRISKLIHHVRQNKQALIAVILNGFPDNMQSSGVEYQNLIQIHRLGGFTLEGAAGLLNSEAMYKSLYVRLENDKGEKLKEKKDYHVGGGNLSISIIDHVNQKVYRANKDGDEYTSEEEQKKALNGIRDEGVAKVSQFLGLNVVANAEAAGFMARKKGSEEDTAVFGGSIMDKVDGKTARGYLPTFSGWDQTALNQSGEKPRLDIGKNGKIISDMLKLAIVDHLVMHGDRNAGNFMLNPDAAEGNSSIVAIDNDVVFGENTFSLDTGGRTSLGALYGIKDRAIVDFGNVLSTGLPMVTEEIKSIVSNIDIEGLQEMLMPYADRVMRLVIVERAKELKQWVEQAPVFDENKEEDIAKFLHLMVKNSMTRWVGAMNIDKKGSLENCYIKFMPGTFVRWLSESYALKTFPWGGAKDTVVYMKAMGLSRAEAEEIFLNNLLADDKESLVTKEQFESSAVGGIMKDYDMPMLEFKKKYNL